jgi:DEAD/DEAH box helicase domain-containing protein
MGLVATKNLVEKRNESFCAATVALLSNSESSEEAVRLLKLAGAELVPFDPSEEVHAGSTDVLNSGTCLPVGQVLEEIKTQDWYHDQIRVHRITEPREAHFADLDPPLSNTIRYALNTARNIDNLYSHQVQAINGVSQGLSVIVSTSTASGKSVIYQLPVLRFLEKDEHSTALFIYPTKALAQDQKTALDKMLKLCPGLEHVTVATYDGDTSLEERQDIRNTASVIFTNFDMIHASILPHEELWRRFFKSLRLFVVDELHYYTGIFGSHVAQIVRRFRRICDALGSMAPLRDSHRKLKTLLKIVAFASYLAVLLSRNQKNTCKAFSV